MPIPGEKQPPTENQSATPIAKALLGETGVDVETLRQTVIALNALVVGLAANNPINENEARTYIQGVRAGASTNGHGPHTVDQAEQLLEQYLASITKYHQTH